MGGTLIDVTPAFHPAATERPAIVVAHERVKQRLGLNLSVAFR